MIDVDVDAANSVVLVQPEAPLDKSDFVELAKAIDPQIETSGDLAGLILDAPKFPGWDSFGALVSHLRFVRDHQKHVKKVAVVTDSPVGDLGEHLASHFVSAKIKHFPAGQTDAAKAWIAGDA
ncbi:STAS/SEC14 domain-containing protein [Mycobacterium sp. Y57]|uniref:STAS/SEC14 domain-containing protein n=1 Tax=Mycolicibacterium xanthum TaxID=2796469 RepID=UPI001C843BDC|nr:STAS/SEC14 domain-containing protein [Mycolicibacterium xanthum]MBX7434599.1 STAS/SEC14 domain-containing protein [Mycolicibacterium xanthum]